MLEPKVYFIGAGPGDPELITVKGLRILRRADMIIYTGSLVNKELLEYAKDSVIIQNSAELNLEEVLSLIDEGWKKKLIIVRLHTGDPSLYGAIMEQIVFLKEKEIPFDIVPGVSSFSAAAAALKKELTLPGVTQTLICTRLEGRTPVPEKEKLSSLAAHGASMAIFLSVHMIGEVVDELKIHLPPETKIAVVHKVSWKDQQIVKGSLLDIREKVEVSGIKKTAIIMVGDFLDSPFEKSRLYDKNFSHGYRNASSI